MNKKENERVIFDLVYKSIFFKNIICSERPDFICELIEGNKVGVEVTECFPSESAARLKKISGYANQLLAGGEYRHKDDLENFRVEEITYLSGGKEPGKKINAIITELLISSRKTEILEKVIDLKASKASAYQKNLSAVDLVVYDTNNIFMFSDFKDLLSLMSSGILLEKIKRSKFREVFLVTSVDYKTRVYVPLKANLLVSEILSFEHYFREYYREENNILISKFYDLLFGYLIGAGFDSAAYKNNEIGYSIYYGSVCFTYGESMKKLMNETTYEIDSGCFLLDSRARTKDIEKGFSDFYLSPTNKIRVCADLYFSVN